MLLLLATPFAAGPLTPKDMQALAQWYAAQSPCKPMPAGNP